MSAELTAMVDRLFTMRAERLALQKQLDGMEEDEKSLKMEVAKALKDVQATGHAGQVGKAYLKIKSVAHVPDWKVLYEHIKATGEFELLHKRVTDTACRERWDSGLTVPGVERVDLEELIVTKA